MLKVEFNGGVIKLDDSKWKWKEDVSILGGVNVLSRMEGQNTHTQWIP